MRHWLPLVLLLLAHGPSEPGGRQPSAPRLAAAIAASRAMAEAAVVLECRQVAASLAAPPAATQSGMPAGIPCVSAPLPRGPALAGDRTRDGPEVV